LIELRRRVSSRASRCGSLSPRRLRCSAEGASLRRVTVVLTLCADVSEPLDALRQE
jgi:hypothetical protein